ncbi:MAG: ATP-binding protein [Oligoflexia bacterium]|nr:ATP-binding protein [Oligoflexia bacterium]
MKKNKLFSQSSFPWRIFFRMVLIQTCLVVAALGASGLAARYFFKQKYINQVAEQLHDTLVGLSPDLNRANARTWCTHRTKEGTMRFLIMSSSGEILCDSQPNYGNLGNLALRKEILDAQLNTYGFDFKFDRKNSDNSLNGALYLGPEELILWGAVSLNSLRETLKLFDNSLTLILLLVASIFMALAIWSARRMVFPLGRLLVKTKNALAQTDHSENSEIDPETLETDSFGEWSDLEFSIDKIRTDLKLKSESLNREREELTTLMSAISDAILAVDQEGVPLFFNTRFALLFGNEEQLQKRNIRLWEMFRAPEILEAFKAALNRGTSTSVKAIEIEQTNNTKQFFSLSVAPLRKQNSEIYGAVGIFHDVTELKGAEQIRIDFVANVSHELRTPLTAIKGYTDTIVEDSKRGIQPKQEFLDVISRNVNRLMALIGDLLDLSALESTDVLQKAQVRTQEVTVRVLNQLQGNFESKKQIVTTHVDAQIVYADPRRLEQVLVNLLDNAHKYTPIGCALEVSWTQERHDVVLKIKDHGPGIPPEHHSRLFERFYRVDKARSREQGGTGLGLAIVKHIMQRHGGSASVESQLGHGATFICRFPI